MRYQIKPQIDQPMRLLIQFDSTKSNNYLCDSELNFDKPTIDQPMRYLLQPTIDQPMRYRKDFRTTYAILSFCDSELTFDKPKVMITYGCIQEMECNSGLSEVLGYPHEGNVRLTPHEGNVRQPLRGNCSGVRGKCSLDTHEGIW